MIEQETPTPLWEKSDDESAKAYHAFCVYRDMSPFERSYQKVSDIVYGKDKANVGQIERWGSKFNWVNRVDAWDDYQRKQLYDLQDEMRQDLTRLQFDDLLKLRDKCDDILDNFDINEYKEIGVVEDPDNPDKSMRVVEHSLRINDIKILTDAIIKIHTAMRLSLGMATSISAQSIGHSFQDEKSGKEVVFRWVDGTDDNGGFEAGDD